MIGTLGVVRVTTAGTPVPLTATRTPANVLSVQLAPSSTTVYIGVAGMNKTTLAGVIAILTSAVPVWSLQSPLAPSAFDLSQLYLDADTNAHGALVAYSNT